MNKSNLGFDQWFDDRLAEIQIPDSGAVRVTAVDRDRYLVHDGEAEIPAELTGKLRFAAESSLDLPTVGDWTLAQHHNNNTQAIIHAVVPRRSVLKRKTAGKKVDFQLIAANIDVAFIMQTCDTDFNLSRLDRYLVMIAEGGIEPVILLSKSDLIGDTELQQRITDIKRAGIDVKTIALSNTSGAGLDQVRQQLRPGRTYCLLGSSGVGKTTLLNRLTGDDSYETNEVRERDGKGKHTTTRRQLIILDQGAMLIDTPGMRELGTIGADTGIDDSFTDIVALARQCRFTDCTHLNEDDCAIMAALASGQLGEQRYQSYLKIRKESQYHQMSYYEKRKKDKALGKMYKSVMKHHNKD